MFRAGTAAALPDHELPPGGFSLAQIIAEENPDFDGVLLRPPAGVLGETAGRRERGADLVVRILVKHHVDGAGGERLARRGGQLVRDDTHLAGALRPFERGEKADLPPALVLQGTNDDNVTPDMADRFAAAYRKAGGSVELEKFPGQPHTFVSKDPTSAASQKAIETIAAFIHKQAGR